mgnify:FL=1
MQYHPEANEARSEKQRRELCLEVNNNAKKTLYWTNILEKGEANFDVHNYADCVYWLEKFLATKSPSFLRQNGKEFLTLMLAEAYIYLQDWKKSLYYANIMCLHDTGCNQNQLDGAFVKKAYCLYRLNSLKKARECIEQAHFLDKLRPTSFLVEMLVTVKQNPENIEKSVRRFLRRFKSMTKLLRYLATVIITTDSFLAEHWKDILFMILHTLKKMQMKKSMGLEAFRSSSLLNMQFSKLR